MNKGKQMKDGEKVGVNICGPCPKNGGWVRGWEEVNRLRDHIERLEAIDRRQQRRANKAESELSEMRERQTELERKYGLYGTPVTIEMFLEELQANLIEAEREIAKSRQEARINLAAGHRAAERASRNLSQAEQAQEEIARLETELQEARDRSSTAESMLVEIGLLVKRYGKHHPGMGSVIGDVVKAVERAFQHLADLWRTEGKRCDEVEAKLAELQHEKTDPTAKQWVCVVEDLKTKLKAAEAERDTNLRAVAARSRQLDKATQQAEMYMRALESVGAHEPRICSMHGNTEDVSGCLEYVRTIARNSLKEGR
jgi:DNA repair exonuclease SbcCD ATPase subunit